MSGPGRGGRSAAQRLCFALCFGLGAPVWAAGEPRLVTSGEGSAKKVEEVADANAAEKEDIDILGIEAMESDGESSSSSSQGEVSPSAN